MVVITADEHHVRGSIYSPFIHTAHDFRKEKITIKTQNMPENELSRAKLNSEWTRARHKADFSP